MNFKEHDNSIVTKEKSDIEKYLLRIIQRYFDIENNYTKESIEEIIMESLTRFKQSVILENGFIFSLNKKTGNLILSVQDFGGQPRFNKNTAFNKEFGIVANTICEGDDPRLSNARTPIYHNHVIGHINGLAELLKPAESAAEIDVHVNHSVINMLRYTGERIEIDLIFLEYLEQSINKYYENLEFSQREAGSILRSGLETIENQLIEVKHLVEVVQDMVTNDINWLPKAKEYADIGITKNKNELLQAILKCLTQANVDTLRDFFKSSYRVITDGEIPLSDGIISCIPVMDSQIIEAGSEEGATLYEIFTEGAQIKVRESTDSAAALLPGDSAILLPGQTVPADWGVGLWTWSDIDNSFYYSYNDQTNYAMFVSANKFETYTHRVTFFANSSDDDLISTVIAYDEETGNELSLAVIAGGFNFPGAYGTSASIILNFKCNWSVGTYATFGTEPNANGDCYKMIGPQSGWSSLANGVTVLVKRTKNNIKAWVNYNTPNIWQSETIDGIKSIYPTTLPDFELNFEDHPELACFVDKKAKYGYGCHSQERSSYRDVYVIGESFSTVTGSAGHANIKETKEISYNVPSAIINTVPNSKIKMYFKHDLEDGTVVTTPLPYSFLDKDNINTVIQGAYTAAGVITIQASLFNKIPEFYASNLAVYQNQLVIGCCKCTPEVIQKLKGYNTNFARIESSAKNDFVKALILDDNLYRIQGESMYWYTGNPTEERYRFSDLTFMSYFNWNLALKDKTKVSISINKNGDWASTGLTSNNYYVLEYKAKKLSDYFINPRVYYQVLGNEG